MSLRDKAAITGIGESVYRRMSGNSVIALPLEDLIEGDREYSS